MDSFKLSVPRKPDEPAAAWRDRAMEVARAEAKAKGLVVRTLRLKGAKGGAMLADGASAIEVLVEYERGAPPSGTATSTPVPVPPASSV